MAMVPITGLEILGGENMPVSTMRDILCRAPKYRGAKTWVDKVCAMPDRQVIAVYFRMLRAGELTTN